MEISKNSKEIFLSDKLNILVKRNDFNDLGTILELEGLIDVYKDYILNFIFYDKNQIIITPNKLILLTNHKNFVFENNLYFYPQIKSYNNNENNSNFNNSNISQEENFFSIKLLNKEIFYFKILLIKKNLNNNKIINLKKNKIINNYTGQSSLNSLSQNYQENNEYFIFFIDCFNLTLVNYDPDKQQIKEKSNINSDYSSREENKNKICYSSNLYKDNLIRIEKKDQINIILEELNKVNASLILEKEIIENKKKEIKAREENINYLILNFKKEIFSYSDKLISEAGLKFSNKVSEISKKISNTEINLVNKYKLIKEKLNSNPKNSKLDSKLNYSKIIELNREKIANLEIRNKQNEENLQSFRIKLSEKEEIIKNFQENDEKQNKNHKKLKDEIFSLNVKIKELNEKLSKYEAITSKLNEDKDKISSYENKNNSAGKNNNNLDNNTNMNNLNNPPINNNKKIQKKNFNKKFELTKNLINEYTENEILSDIIDFDFLKNYNTLFNKIYVFSTKEYYSLSNILICFNINPINLFKEFPLSLIILAKKLSILLMKINYREISISCESINLQSNVGNFMNRNNDNELNALKDIFSEISNNFQEVIKSINDSCKNNQDGNNDFQISGVNNNLFYHNPLICIEYKSKIEKIINPINNVEVSSNNSLGGNFIESMNNNYEIINLNNIYLKKIQYFLNNYFNKKESKFIEKKNFVLYKISKISLFLFEIYLSNNPGFILNNITKINENYIIPKDNIVINYLLKNFFLEKLLIILKNLNSKKIDIINNFCKIFLDIFLFLYANDFIFFNNPKDGSFMNSLNQNEFSFQNPKLDFNKIFKILFFENENFLNYIRNNFKNQLEKINNNSICSDSINDNIRKIIIFASIIKSKFPNEFNLIFSKSDQNYENIIKDKVNFIKNKENDSILDINNESSQNNFNVIEENILNIFI